MTCSFKDIKVRRSGTSIEDLNQSAFFSNKTTNLFTIKKVSDQYINQSTVDELYKDEEVIKITLIESVYGEEVEICLINVDLETLIRLSRVNEIILDTSEPPYGINAAEELLCCFIVDLDGIPKEVYNFMKNIKGCITVYDAMISGV